MKSAYQILKKYGILCVQENKLNQTCYPDDEQGRMQAHIDEKQESNIKGQKEALEWIMEGM